MEKNETLSKEEARVMLKRLEEFYGEPVLPIGKFCGAMELWMECIEKVNKDPELSGGVPRQGHSYYKELGHIRIDIRKSNLLGRLLYAKERFRTRMCPVHKGHYSGEAMFFTKCPHKCDGTGWLREREQDQGYTNVLVRKAKMEDGKWKYKDPETGEWKPDVK